MAFSNGFRREQVVVSHFVCGLLLVFQMDWELRCGALVLLFALAGFSLTRLTNFTGNLGFHPAGWHGKSPSYLRPKRVFHAPAFDNQNACSTLWPEWGQTASNSLGKDLLAGSFPEVNDGFGAALAKNGPHGDIALSIGITSRNPSFWRPRH